MEDLAINRTATDQSGLWIVTDQQLRQIVEVLRPAAARLRCFACLGPLEFRPGVGRVCAACDRP